MLLRREHGKKGKTKEVGLSAANNKRVWNSHCQVLLLLLDAASRGSWGFFVGDSQAHTHTPVEASGGYPSSLCVWKPYDSWVMDDGKLITK